MTILLHNLLARPPRLQDLADVTSLLIAEDMAEDGLSDYTEEELFAEWHRPGFSMELDAWVVVSGKGQFVGYADVWRNEAEQVEMRVRVHPEYRGRGIGTLLLRLAEARARQLARKAPGGVRIALVSSVNAANVTARRLLEHEGFEAVRQFWRMMVSMDEPVDGNDQLKVDLIVNVQELIGLAQQPRTGMYVVRQYDTYEKELRAGTTFWSTETLDIDSCMSN